jgi:integrase/recombinase XerD
MQTFDNYLETKGYRPLTLTAYKREHRKTMQWLREENLDPENLQYKNLLVLIGHCRAQGRSTGDINKVLNVARLYFNYLIKEGRATENPALGLSVKGYQRRIPHSLLEPEVLAGLYQGYRATGAKRQRNKAMLGLLIYQGLSIGELEKLGAGHLKLREGKIQVPGGIKSNGRTLALEAPQILDLQEYLQISRPQLLKEARQYQRSQTGKEDPEGPLFFSTEGGEKLQQTVRHMVQELKENLPETGKLTAMKVRESVIAHWLKTKDIRIVQYMAGHKYASSTERYKEARLEALIEALEAFHPLN